MSPSDQSLPRPNVPTAPAAAPAAAPGPAGRGASGHGVAVPALAALVGAATLLLPVLDPLGVAPPWALPLVAAGTGAATGLALFCAWTARRRPPQPQPQATPAAPAGQAEEEARRVADAVRIAALEEALREAEHRTSDRLRAQQIAALEARAELACAIVHDVNNALGTVAGYADFLAADLPAGSPQADYAERILSAVDRARPGFRRLVMAARMEPASVVQERATCVLDEAASLLGAASAVPASLVVRYDAATPDPLCDAGLLARTLAGLAAEIVLATDGGVDLRFCLRAGLSGVPRGGGDPDGDAAGAGWHVRRLLQPREGVHALFELRVNGAPLADELLFALVDPLLSVRKRYRRGQPLREDADWPTALSTARRHDGGLSLLTHPVEGTAVRLYIPAVPADRTAPVPAVLQTPSAQRKLPVLQVLVVEADPASGDRFQTGLEQQGFEVSVCDDLRDALDVVADEPGFFDAVVIGPGLSALPAGLALAGRLKELRGDLPCVLYGAEAACDPAGPADLVLPTPVDLPRLARGVAALAAGGAGGRRAGGAQG